MLLQHETDGEKYLYAPVLSITISTTIHIVMLSWEVEEMERMRVEEDEKDFLATIIQTCR